MKLLDTAELLLNEVFQPGRMYLCEWSNGDPYFSHILYEGRSGELHINFRNATNSNLLFVKSSWLAGTESHMFNPLDLIYDLGAVPDNMSSEDFIKKYYPELAV